MPFPFAAERPRLMVVVDQGRKKQAHSVAAVANADFHQMNKIYTTKATSAQGYPHATVALAMSVSCENLSKGAALNAMQIHACV
jgi:hypothetical protein